MKKEFAIAAAAAIAALAWTGRARAQAGPMLKPKCAERLQVAAPPNGAGVFFDAECKTAYVLPPIAGAIKMEAIARTAMLDQCSTLQSFSRVFEIKARQLAALAERLEKEAASTKPVGGSPLFPGGAAPAPQPSQPDAAWLEEYEKTLDAYSRAMDRMKTFWETPGATAQFSYTIRSQELVSAYQRLNPRLVFRSMPLHESKIYMARRIGEGAAATSVPAVLFASIPGSGGPIGANRQAGEVGDDLGVVSGEAQSGQITFSLAGACPYYDSASRTMPKELAGADLAAHMVAKTQYAYELTSTRRYEAKYNLANFVRRLKTSETRGGFFTTKTVNRMIVEENSKDWFDVQVEADDGRWVYDADFAQQLKAQIIDRALRNLAAVVQGGAVEAPAQTQPGASGASVAAGELRKCAHLYCQVGAGVLDVASAIFGGSVSTAEFIRTQDIWVTESARESRPFRFQGTVDFRGPG